MKISNNKPIQLDPIYHDPVGKPMDYRQLIEDVFVTPMLTPMVTNTPVTITQNGRPVTNDQIIDLIEACGQDAVNPSAETMAKDLFHQTLAYFNPQTNLGASEIFVGQAAAKEKMLEPSATIRYTPGVDVIPTCREFLAGTCSYETFFASLAFYARPEALGFYFANESAFDNFKAWVGTKMNGIGPALPMDTNKMMTDFQTLTLDGLTESLLLRDKDHPGIDPNCFPRLIVSLLMEYTTVAGPGEFGCLPFSVPELFVPNNLIFVNVEKHSRASTKAVKDEWEMIEQSIHGSPIMISNNKLNKLTAAQRNLKRIAGMAYNAGMATQLIDAQRAANMRFSSKRPTTVDMARIIKKMLNKMAFVNRSMNTFRSVKHSYAKPNRRDPDDFNKQGKIVNTRFLPDIHVYVDTSGSISEEDYEDAIKALIKMAKTLNIGLYFNSFSTVLSQTTRLHLQDRSQKEIYREVQRLPKVTGGTDYEQIWHFINRSKKRRRELSLIITDFEWSAPRRFIPHPKNLYYMPCTTMNWSTIQRNAKYFAESTTHNDPNIRKHILF